MLFSVARRFSLRQMTTSGVSSRTAAVLDLLAKQQVTEARSCLFAADNWENVIVDVAALAPKRELQELLEPLMSRYEGSAALHKCSILLASKDFKKVNTTTTMEEDKIEEDVAATSHRHAVVEGSLLCIERHPHTASIVAQLLPLMKAEKLDLVVRIFDSRSQQPDFNPRSEIEPFFEYLLRVKDSGEVVSQWRRWSQTAAIASRGCVSIVIQASIRERRSLEEIDHLVQSLLAFHLDPTEECQIEMMEFFLNAPSARVYRYSANLVDHWTVRGGAACSVEHWSYLHSKKLSLCFQVQVDLVPAVANQIVIFFQEQSSSSPHQKKHIPVAHFCEIAKILLLTSAPAALELLCKHCRLCDVLIDPVDAQGTATLLVTVARLTRLATTTTTPPHFESPETIPTMDEQREQLLKTCTTHIRHQSSDEFFSSVIDYALQLVGEIGLEHVVSAEDLKTVVVELAKVTERVVPADFDLWVGYWKGDMRSVIEQLGQ